MSHFLFNSFVSLAENVSGASATPSAEGAKLAVDGLERRLHRALLTMEALWTLLRERSDITDADLADRIVELDMSDGTLDGKVRRPPLQCRRCRRTIPRRFARCMYCGAHVKHDPFA